MDQNAKNAVSELILLLIKVRSRKGIFLILDKKYATRPLFHIYNYRAD